jgi:peptide/nickel transport system substrate-binding protein
MSTRVWVTSRTTLVPFSDEVQITTDLAAGVSGAGIWAKTARFKDQVGGSMTIGLPSVFTEPWNPLGGSNWVFDNMVKRGVGDAGTYADPNTGLFFPGRVERAEVVVQEGFPTGVSLDWVSLSFAPEIVVPDDAWAGWDATNQVFLTAAEVYTETQTAVFKSTVYYPEDLFDTMTWHDGSPMSVADFLMYYIVLFDAADEASANYDESLVPGRDQFVSAFRGMRLVSADPFVMEYYATNAGLDAENMVVTFWPTYDYGDETAWHNMALMLRGDANGSFAFTPDKAEANEVERISTIAGPSLEVLATELAAATEENYIPYAPTLGQFITAEEAAARYSNLAEFARRYGHYYLGTGWYFLQGVFPVESQAILQRYEAHPDPSDRYANFSAPALADVEVDGDSRVTIGADASFDIFVDVFGGPYAVDDIDSVTYLLFDATGTQVGVGQAEAVEDGLWQVSLGGDMTESLVEGSNRLEIVVVSKLVALPSLGSFEFVTAP